MKSALALAIVLALGAGTVHAKATYCQDPTTHKRISCKAAGAASTPASAPAAPAAATPAAPAKKPSMLSRMMAPKPAAAPAPSTAAATTTASATPAPGHKGIKCGKSYIAANKVCHKPS